MSMSFLDIDPRSPWELSLAERAKDGVPTDESVAEIFDATNPLFPTPQSMTLDWHLLIRSMASLNVFPS